MPSENRLVLLDRDGTVNVERHYLANPDEVELIPNAARAIRQMRELGLKVVLITNQSAIGRGYFDTERLHSIHSRLCDLLATEEAGLDAIYFCPHAPEEDCDCRKPKSGMLQRAAEEFQSDPTKAFVIGDKACDIEFGRSAGATTFLVKTGYGLETHRDGAIKLDYVVTDLLEVAKVIAELLEKERGA